MVQNVDHRGRMLRRRMVKRMQPSSLASSSFHSLLLIGFSSSLKEMLGSKGTATWRPLTGGHSGGGQWGIMNYHLRRILRRPPCEEDAQERIVGRRTLGRTRGYFLYSPASFSRALFPSVLLLMILMWLFPASSWGSSSCGCSFPLQLRRTRCCFLVLPNVVFNVLLMCFSTSDILQLCAIYRYTSGKITST